MAIDSPVAGKLHFCVTAIIMYSGYNCNGNVVTCQWANTSYNIPHGLRIPRRQSGA